MIWLLVLSLPIWVVLVALALRPLYLFRGMTHEERIREWPGDHLVPGAKPSGSRAVTIHAPSEEVWLWVTQIGQDRAGFYSYRWLENLAGAEMPNISHLVSEWSNRKVGQKLLMAPVKRFGDVAAMEVVEAKPYSHLVAKNSEGTWAFIVIPIDHRSCRFLARGTWAPPKSLVARLFHTVVFDPIHYIMEWKMVREIKRLSEKAWLPRRSSKKLRGSWR